MQVNYSNEFVITGPQEVFNTDLLYCTYHWLLNAVKVAFDIPLRIAYGCDVTTNLHQFISFFSHDCKGFDPNHPLKMFMQDMTLSGP